MADPRINFYFVAGFMTIEAIVQQVQRYKAEGKKAVYQFIVSIA
jgi:hypothetical protein